MKAYYIGAATAMLLSLMIYPFLKQLAIAERGHNAIGGEETILLFGGLIAVCIIQIGLERKRKKDNDDDEQK